MEVSLLSFSRLLFLSLILSILYAVISSTYMFKKTNGKVLGITTLQNGKRTKSGMILHFFVYWVLSFLLLWLGTNIWDRLFGN